MQTEHIQNALADCGWSDARELEQQDTSEAFAFITETLQLPLLALQVDLFHHGKRDTDDHKVVHERLLNLAVPADPEGKGIKLEDCLEEYFNNKVEVLRDSPEEKKDRQNSSSSLRSTIRLVTSMEGDAGAERETEGSRLYQRLSSQDGLGLMESPITMTSSSSLSPDIVSGPELKRPSIRHRSTSLIQRIEVDDKGNVTDADPMVTNRLRRSGSTVVKAVTIPAWQFFRLIRKSTRYDIPWPRLPLTSRAAWHATSDVQPKSDIDVARQFNQRPVVGICLKRYTMTEQGFPQRHNTLIDIPDSLRLPHFMMASDQADAEPSELSLEYKLVLQGVVCHRGDSLHSGHYISFSRVAPKLLTDNRRHDNDPPPDYEEAQWAKFDDLAIEERVSYVDDIKQALKEEMPYLLFYQIVPMVDVTATSTDGSVTEPPSYDESALSASATLPQTPQLEGGADRPGVMSRSASGYFDSAPTLAQSSGGPSIRFSSDLERPVRLSFDEDPYGTYLKVNLNSASRDNAIVPDVGSPTPSAHSEAVSPATVWQDDTATARLSRAAARFTKSGSRSRPSSQAGEGRISLTMTRLGLTKSSKEPLRDAGANASGVNVSVTSVEGIDEPYVVVDEVEPKERDSEKDHHFLKHHHHRGKSKNRGDRDRGKSKEGKTDGVPDRECSIM